MAHFARITTLFLLGCTLICCTESNASAQDAEAVFRRCVERINQINERVTNAQRETVRECVPRIRRLLEMGEIEEARHVARRCIAKLDSITDSGLQALRDTCGPCLERLRRLKAYRLAERLARICEENAHQLKHQNRRAQNIIRELF